MGQLILMVEDNLDILDINRSILTHAGYTVLEAETIQAAWTLFQQENPMLIILDVMLPDGSGLDFCHRVRQVSNVPILFLSALGESKDVVRGFLGGGDDYLTKPYDLDIFLVRIQALLRRYMQDSAPLDDSVAELQLKRASGRATLNGRDLLLTHMEFAVLEYLVRNRDRHVTAEELYQTLWNMDAAGDLRTVWAHISRIRKKFGSSASIDISSERKRGYKLTIQ